MRNHLEGEAMNRIRLKDWNFVCPYERAGRDYRVAEARAAKRHARQKISAEIGDLVAEATTVPDGDDGDIAAGRRRRRRDRKRLPPHICVRGSGGSGHWILPVRCLGGYDFFRSLNDRLSLRDELERLAAEFPGARDFPVRFLGCVPMDLPGWEILRT